jgi:probable HAF family extracellular repeat protein
MTLTTKGDKMKKLILNLIVFILSITFTKNYAQSLTWLGTLVGGTFAGDFSNAYGVSADGSVVVGNTKNGSGYIRAFRWTAAGGMQDLGTLGGNSSVAWGVSADGSVVVGNAANASGKIRAFRWTAAGGMQDLGTLGGDLSYAYGVSADGSVVVGVATNASGRSRAFRWTAAGGMQDLGTLGGNSSQAWGVSADGSVVVGFATTASGFRAFRWMAAGGMQDLGTLGGELSYAYDVSADGSVVVGEAEYESGKFRAFRWTAASGMQDLGTLGGNGSEAWGVSADGSVVVGLSVNANGQTRAFRWTAQSGMQDLNQLYANLLQNGSNLYYAWAISPDGRYIVGDGYNAAATSFVKEAYLLDTETQTQLNITQPNSISKLIAGQLDTIKWIGGQPGQTLQIEYSTDNGSNWFEVGYASGTDGQYIWEVPENILTTKAKIKITDIRNTPNFVVSDNFKIKPYILTRIDPNGDYYEFKKNRDQWNFWNWIPDMWPKTWWQQFKYRGIDPFTGNKYSQTQGNGIFAKAQDYFFPDWVSWVRAFGVKQCYHSITQSIYNINALLKWWSLPIEKGWNGSCFGIAAASALAFRYKDLFLNRFPGFPSFTDPIEVDSSGNVRRVVNELFTHQFGFFSELNDTISINKTPVQTLNELKELLLEDNATIRTITIINQNPTTQNPSGGHTILAYALEQDTSQGNLFYVKVYDNSKPLSTTPITIDIFANGGNGSWSTPDYPNWGGSKGLYLEIPSEYYLNNAILYKNNNTNSPFILAQTDLEINYPSQSNIKIIDSQGNETSYENGAVINDIPGAKPKIIKNGSSMPPYGYMLKNDNYSVILKDFVQDTVNIFFFTGNKSFMYERYGAYNEQFDNLYFDGGLEVSNNNSETKTTTLLNLISEGTQEKLFIASSLDIDTYSSVKIENPDSNTVKIISTGLDDNYDIELNYVTAEKLDKFIAKDIWLPANASQTFLPEWSDLTNYDLKVLIDFDNDGTADDTLYLQNQFTEVKDILPEEYNLAQNYPNPFNSTTKIRFAIPYLGTGLALSVQLKVFDILGNEVATLVNEEKAPGTYEVEFNATQLSSGVYFYRLKSGDFVETKKMILLR